MSKITGTVASLFLFLGVIFLSTDLSNLFFWIWTLFMLFALVLWIYSFLKGHQWLFEVTPEYVSFDSPFMPKSKAKVSINDIWKVTISDGETTSGEIYMTNGESIRIPSPCLGKTKEISEAIQETGIELFVNNQRIN